MFVPRWAQDQQSLVLEAAVFMMRFDMRAPTTGAPAGELYRAAVEMAAYAESRGAIVAGVSEHHTSDDGYLPSPLVMASAFAAATSSLHIMVAALLLPLYDPIRLAEEMCVLDVLSGGRVSYVAAIGYRPVEYEMFGIDYSRRGKLADEALAVLLQAKTGQPFELNGRRIHVTPAPVTPGGPQVAWGGGSVAAARRAGRFGINFFGQREDPALEPAYREAALAAGHEPGMCIQPSRAVPSITFVAEDVDRAWEELGPYLMHDARTYAEWNAHEPSDTVSLSFAETLDELRAENGSHRVLTVEQAVDLIRSGQPLPLHPLVGGLPPEIAWRYLKVVTERVMPALQ